MRGVAGDGDGAAARRFQPRDPPQQPRQRVLAATKPSKITKGADAGTFSKARFRTDEAVTMAARERVDAILANYPLYPELDLELLTSEG